MNNIVVATWEEHRYFIFIISFIAAQHILGQVWL